LAGWVTSPTKTSAVFDPTLTSIHPGSESINFALTRADLSGGMKRAVELHITAPLVQQNLDPHWSSTQLSSHAQRQITYLPKRSSGSNGLDQLSPDGQTTFFPLWEPPERSWTVCQPLFGALISR
jgi:hypothetical protein